MPRLPLCLLPRDPCQAAKRLLTALGRAAETFAAEQAARALQSSNRDEWRYWLEVRRDMIAQRLRVTRDETPQAIHSRSMPVSGAMSAALASGV